MNQPLYLIANWKMNPATQEGANLLLQATSTPVKGEKIQVIVCPPYQYLHLLDDYAKIHAGAQNCYFEESGAYTGEVSAKMVKNTGCRFVIVGHSERRAMGEDNETVNKKVLSVLKEGMSPIIAIGDKERNAAGDENSVSSALRDQLVRGLKGVSARNIKNVIIAYEPVWAIGTGKTADTDDILMVRILIQKELRKLYGNASRSTPIIYGGSVSSKTAVSLLKETGVQGLLVGGASVKNNGEDFVKMYNAITQEL